MKPFTVTIKDISKGLAPAGNPRNNPMLADSVGAYPFDGALQQVPSFALIDVTSLGTVAFPYPQVFVTSNFIIVCTATDIYEYVGSSLVNKFGPVAADQTWTLLDFKDYLYISNGTVAITRSVVSGIYSLDTTVPAARAACNYNGQVLLGSPKEN